MSKRFGPLGGARRAPQFPPPRGLVPTLWQKHAFAATTELGHRQGLGLVSPEAKADGPNETQP